MYGPPIYILLIESHVWRMNVIILEPARAPQQQNTVKILLNSDLTAQT